MKSVIFMHHFTAKKKILLINNPGANFSFNRKKVALPRYICCGARVYLVFIILPAISAGDLRRHSHYKAHNIWLVLILFLTCTLNVGLAVRWQTSDKQKKIRMHRMCTRRHISLEIESSLHIYIYISTHMNIFSAAAAVSYKMIWLYIVMRKRNLIKCNANWSAKTGNFQQNLSWVHSNFTGIVKMCARYVYVYICKWRIY